MEDKMPLRLRDIPINPKDKDGLPSIPKEKLTLGQKAADGVAKVAGSWIFIIGVILFITGWIILNIFAWTYSWDVWPFILLNLALSCMAALQAPVILMSQNRAAERDRLYQRYDYLVDRKTSRDVEKIIKELSTIKQKLDKMDKGA